MKALNVISHSEEQTEALAEKLSLSFSGDDIVVLSGPLGAGKTVFVRGLVQGRGLDPDRVNSPSFTMLNEYRGDKPVYHFDLYRMHDVDELREIGLDEYLARDGVVVIEWGEKATDILPRPHYFIEIKLVSDQDREINISLVQP